MNKFCKSISRIALSLILVLNCISFASVSVSAVTYTMKVEAPSTAETGDTITVNVNVSAIKTYGGHFTMSYDKSKLSLVSAEKGGLVSAQDLTASVNGDSENGTVKGSWAKGSTILKSGAAAVCKFKCIDEGSCTFSIDESAVFNADGEEQTVTVTNAAVEITKAADTSETTTETTTNAESGAEIVVSAPEKCRTSSYIDVDVITAENSLAYGGNAVISYDSSLFTYDSIVSGSALSTDAVMSVNTSYGEGKIKISWADNTEYTEALKLATIKFKSNTTEGTGVFDVTEGIISDGNGKVTNTYCSKQSVVITDSYTNDDFDVLSTGSTQVKFANDSANSWQLDTEKSSGTTLARSPQIGDDGTTSVTATVTGAGTLKFDWAVSSEDYEDAAEFDYMTFSIDGVEQARIAGEKDVATVTIDISEGEHTLTWTYQKDDSGSDGSDCGWFGNVNYSTAGLLGDADNNGVVDLRDAVAVLNYVENGVEMAGAKNADVNNDEAITSKDAALILKYCTGAIEAF